MAEEWKDLLDIINGLSQTNITPKIYSAKFDTALPEYNLINPIKINLCFSVKCKHPFFPIFQ